MKKRKCSWRKARERTTLDETCDTPDDNTILEPTASVVRCALVNKLYYTSVSCVWVSCLHLPALGRLVSEKVTSSKQQSVRDPVGRASGRSAEPIRCDDTM